MLVLPPGVLVEGASAIHSALAVSGLLIWSVLLTDWPTVSSDNDTVTFVPFTVTLAEMWSPGWIAMFSFVSGAGSSSYQAEYCVRPLATSAEVPTCSSAVDCGLAPPKPTQKLE